LAWLGLAWLGLAWNENYSFPYQNSFILEFVDRFLKS